jgi:hypothetical protein
MEIDLISPPKIKDRVNPFTKANTTFWFPTLNAQHNRCESGALYHAEQLNGQNDRVSPCYKGKDKHLDSYQTLTKKRQIGRHSNLSWVVFMT